MVLGYRRGLKLGAEGGLSFRRGWVFGVHGETLGAVTVHVFIRNGRKRSCIGGVLNFEALKVAIAVSGIVVTTLRPAFL